MKREKDKSCHGANSEFPDESETTLRDALYRTPWFARLPESEQRAVLAESRELTIPAGGCLLRVGEMPKGWFGVMEGILKWVSLGEDGRSVSIAGLSAGSWFGEASLVRAQPYGYHVFALRRSRLVVIPQETCDRLLEEQIVFSRAVMRHLAERVNLFMATFTAQVLANMEVKIARTLASMFHKELHPRTQLHLRISQEELANLCGISRQRCNRVLKRLHELQLIDVGYAGITVLNLEGLRQFNNSGACLPEG